MKIEKLPPFTAFRYVERDSELTDAKELLIEGLTSKINEIIDVLNETNEEEK